MVIMHIKKNELSTKIIASDFDMTSNDIILPLPSFKQCLGVIGINLSPMVSNFSHSCSIAIATLLREGRGQPEE